jgi:3-methyl-2-oxobutanoate hydroxymethyltransferase
MARPHPKIRVETNLRTVGVARNAADAHPVSIPIGGERAMSSQTRPRRLSVTQIQARKGGDKIVCLTAYTASVARHLDAEVDLLLVGDSLAMTVYGFDSTLPVTLDMMIAHGAAVVRATSYALITVDLPFGSYQEAPEQAFRAAARVLAETGCAAVKLEGGEEMADTIAFLTRRGIPVMGHVGLTPQAVNALGGYRSRGHADAERDKILRDGIAVAEAGAFSMVIEGTAESVARELTGAVAIPTIGIGGSVACDGQILVTDDMLGLFAEFTPKFVKRYRRLGDEIRAAAREYGDEVRAGQFPAEEHTYRGPRRAKSPTAG